MFERTDSSTSPNGDASERTDEARQSSAEVSTPSDGRPSDWIREAFFSRVGAPSTESQEGANEGKPESNGKTEDAKPAGQSNSEQSGVFDQPKPYRVFNSPDDYERQLQSEVDRREAVRAQKQKARDEADLLENHPAEYARVKREELAEQKKREELQPVIQKEALSFANEQVLTYDSHVLTPLLALLPDSPEKDQAMQTTKPAIEGRGEIFKSAIALYEKHVTAKALSEARKTLAQDPAFIKEILVRHGGQRAEPEVVSAVGAAPGRGDDSMDSAMNTMLRGRGRQRL